MAEANVSIDDRCSGGISPRNNSRSWRRRTKMSSRFTSGSSRAAVHSPASSNSASNSRNAGRSRECGGQLVLLDFHPARRRFAAGERSGFRRCRRVERR